MKEGILAKIILGVAAVAVIGSGIYFATKTEPARVSLLTDNSTEINNNLDEKQIVELDPETSSDTIGVLKKIIDNSSSQTVYCTYKVKNSELGVQDAEIFIKNSGEYRVDQGKDGLHILAFDKKYYLWGNYGADLPKNTGMILDYIPQNEDGSESGKNLSNGIITPEALLTIVENSDYHSEISDLACVYNNSISDDLFIIPKDVDFMSMSELMKMSM